VIRPKPLCIATNQSEPIAAGASAEKAGAGARKHFFSAKRGKSSNLYAKRGKTFNRSQARVNIKQGQSGKTVDWQIDNDVMDVAEHSCACWFFRPVSNRRQTRENS